MRNTSAESLRLVLCAVLDLKTCQKLCDLRQARREAHVPLVILVPIVSMRSEYHSKELVLNQRESGSLGFEYYHGAVVPSIKSEWHYFL